MHFKSFKNFESCLEIELRIRRNWANKCRAITNKRFEFSSSFDHHLAMCENRCLKWFVGFCVIHFFFAWCSCLIVWIEFTDSLKSNHSRCSEFCCFFFVIFFFSIFWCLSIFWEHAHGIWVDFIHIKSLTGNQTKNEHFHTNENRSKREKNNNRIEIMMHTITSTRVETYTSEFMPCSHSHIFTKALNHKYRWNYNWFSQYLSGNKWCGMIQIAAYICSLKNRILNFQWIIPKICKQFWCVWKKSCKCENDVDVNK